MEASVWRAYLQRFWAAGYDLRPGVRQGWLHSARLTEWSPEELWVHLSQLPLRRGWAFQEPVHRPSSIVHMLDRNRSIADYGQIIEKVLYGAELGIRTAVQKLNWWPDRGRLRSSGFYLPVVWSSWSRLLNPDQPAPRYHLDPLDRLVQHYGPEILSYQPYQESTTILPKAFLQGLLWPGWLEQARASLAQFDKDYTGAAWPAALWMTQIAATLSSSVKSPVAAYYAAFTTLPKTSQVRAMAMMTWAAYTKGQSYAVWWKRLCRQTYYYPSQHVVPNLAIIFAALCWGQGHWDTVLDYIGQSGFDVVGNATLAGALHYVHYPNPSMDGLDDQSLDALQRLRETIETRTYLRPR